LTSSVKVTLPPAGIIVFKVKIAVAPERVVVTPVAPLETTRLVIPEAGFPLPDSVTVKPVIVIAVLPGFERTIVPAGTLAVPGNCVELAGGRLETVTVTAVGVPVELLVAVKVAEFVVVAVAVNVGVLVRLGVALFVGVLDGVAVNVLVTEGVSVTVKVVVGVVVPVMVGV